MCLWYNPKELTEAQKFDKQQGKARINANKKPEPEPEPESSITEIESEEKEKEPESNSEDDIDLSGDDTDEKIRKSLNREARPIRRAERLTK